MSQWHYITLFVLEGLNCTRLFRNVRFTENLTFCSSSHSCVSCLSLAHTGTRTASQLLDLIIQTVVINQSIAANIGAQWAVYYFSSVGLPCSNQ